MQQALKEAIIDTDFINKITLATGIDDAKDLIRYSGIRNVKVLNLVDVYTIIGKKVEKSIILKEVECVIRCVDSSDSPKQKKIKKEKYNRVKAVWQKD